MSKKLLFVFTMLMSFILVTGCAGAADYDVELPGGYSVLKTSAHEVTIAPKTSDTSWGANKVPAKVTEVGWNKEFIIAKQVDMVEDPESNSGVEIPEEQNVFYWILNIENGGVTGPLNELDFINKKEELRISDEVLLKEVESLKSNN